MPTLLTPRQRLLLVVSAGPAGGGSGVPAPTVVTPAQWLLLVAALRGGSVAPPVVPELPGDLLEAVERALRGGPLTAGGAAPAGFLAEWFGEVVEEYPAGSGVWHHSRVRRSESEPEDVLPRAVLEFDLITDSDTAYDGVTTERRRLKADVYATSDSEATMLAKRFRRFFRFQPGPAPADDPVAGEIEWEDGIVIGRWPDGSEPEEIDPQNGANGQKIRGRRVRILFEVQYNSWEA